MPVPNSSTGGKISMKCIANEYGFSENTIPLSLDDLSNLIAKDRKHAMSEFSTCEFEDTATWLLIGGGGGGGSHIGGGGGAGGYRCGSWDIASLFYSGSNQTVNITIGAGGNKATSWCVSANNGSPSSFSTSVSATVVAGGGGAGGNAPATDGCDATSPQNGTNVGVLTGTGGSGGGGYGYACYGGGYTITPGASGSDGGNNGGNGYGHPTVISYSAGGGGGGSCCIGGNAASDVVGTGGLGCRTIVKGLQEVYSNGGDGAKRVSGIGSDGSINTGNGGEGGGSFGDDGGNGGSGLFVVSYYSLPDLQGNLVARLQGGSISCVDNRVIHTFTASGTLCSYASNSDPLDPVKN